MTKILLVEDNEMNQDMLTRRLLRRGYEVVLASDGEQGVSMGITELPDLILMDISLPVMNGWEASRQLKAHPQTCQIPIIALTAHAMVGDRDKCMAAGCDDYDTKPVELARLLGKVEQLLTKCEVSGKTNDRIADILIDPTPPPVQIPVQVATVLSRSVDPTAAIILVVDDNEANRDMLSRRLERSGYKVLMAEGGQAGLDLIRTQPIDLVLLDIMMPEMSGLEALKIIRDQFSMAQLPVIMATAKDRSEDMLEAFELGANDYVTKPIELPLVLARIQSHLRAIQTARQEQPIASEKIEPTLVMIAPLTAVSVAIPDPIIVEKVDFASQLLRGRYKISKQLTQGSFRNTYLAQDLQADGQPNCIVEQLDIGSDREDIYQAATKQLEAEVRAFRAISSSNIVKVLGAFKQDKFFYTIQAEALGEKLSDQFQAGQTLSLPDALMMILEMLETVQILHQHQLIHQHLQPLSFLYCNDRNLSLVDLGIAPRLAGTLCVDDSQPLTIYYPYGQQGSQLSIRSDIYAIGTMILQALTGIPPNQMPVDSMTGAIHWRHLRIVSASFARILDKMISTNLDIYYHSIDSVLKDLYQLPSVSLIDKRSKSIF